MTRRQPCKTKGDSISRSSNMPPAADREVEFLPCCLSIVVVLCAISLRTRLALTCALVCLGLCGVRNYQGWKCEASLSINLPSNSAETSQSETSTSTLLYNARIKGRGATDSLNLFSIHKHKHLDLNALSRSSVCVFRIHEGAMGCCHPTCLSKPAVELDKHQGLTRCLMG